MSWKLFKRNRNNQAVIDAMPPDNQINIGTNTAPINMGDNSFGTVTPYVEPTDKELIEGLDEGGNYEAACRITALKKEVANLKRKLTILQKKYDEKTN